MDVSAKLASGWCKRFGAAASTKDAGDASDKSAGDGGEAKLPAGFELAPEAKEVAAHRVTSSARRGAGRFFPGAARRA